MDASHRGVPPHALKEVIGDNSNVSRLVVEKTYGTEGRTTVRVT